MATKFREFSDDEEKKKERVLLRRHSIVVVLRAKMKRVRGTAFVLVLVLVAANAIVAPKRQQCQCQLIPIKTTLTYSISCSIQVTTSLCRPSLLFRPNRRRRRRRRRHRDVDRRFSIDCANKCRATTLVAVPVLLRCSHMLDKPIFKEVYTALRCSLSN